jgi:mRNA-degrading endonuclease RelE of RelBE toxin-antitoxin system
MLKLDLSKQAFAFLEKLPAKQGRQVAEKLTALCNDPAGVPSEGLKVYAPLRRVKAGEFRIVFVVEGGALRVRLIAKRNDDEVYKLLRRGLSQ